jgi:VRR-NUC domain/FAN1, HTH domain
VNAHPRPYYYLENFNVALDWLRSRYGELLSADEQRFMADFARLPLQSAALLVRMIMRQGDLFRTSKLNYSEIGPPEEAARPLIELGWIEPRPAVAFTDLCRLMRKSELVDILGLHGTVTAGGMRKAEIVGKAGELAEACRPLHEWWPLAPDAIYRVRIAPLCERLRLMFFGNFRQTWSEFVLADLGIFRYEKVGLEPLARAFQTREQIERFHAIYHCRELLDAEAALNEVLEAVPAPAADAPAWIEAKRAKLLFHIGQLLEKEQQYPQALEVYASSQHPEARMRTIRVLEKLQRFAQASELLTQVQQAPANEFEIQLAARVQPRLNRKLGVTTSRPRPRAWADMILDLPYPDPPLRVELAVSHHLSTPDAPVIYVENTLLNTLFGLLCWDAIFAPLPGAFFHAFHAGPADLLEPGFHQRREALFCARLAELDTGAYRSTILERFEEKNGIQSPFVAWGAITRDELELALDCIPATHLYKCFKRLLTDVRANRSGLPDLIQLWREEHRYRLIEVKGPGDRLQDNQVRWLDFCHMHQIPVCVCKVTWQDQPS